MSEPTDDYMQWLRSSDPAPEATAYSEVDNAAADETRPMPALRPVQGVPHGASGPRGQAVGFDPHAWSQPAEPVLTRQNLTASASGWNRSAVRATPASGWRKAVYVATGHLINPGENPADVRSRELDARLRQPVEDRDYSIAVLSIKGGSAKTTTTIALGNAFAEVRGDGVIAVDVNPDCGNLADRINRRTDSSVRDLLADPQVLGRRDISRHTNESPARLEVLASPLDPAVSESFSAADYSRVYQILREHYAVILSDNGTGVKHDALDAVLASASTVVVPMAAKVDSADAATKTLDWLYNSPLIDPETGERRTDHSGRDIFPYRHLVSTAVVVVSHQRPGRPEIDMRSCREHFANRVRAVVEIPFDPHLSEGALIDPARLSKKTREAWRALAGVVADDFGRPSGRRRRTDEARQR